MDRRTDGRTGPTIEMRSCIKMTGTNAFLHDFLPVFYFFPHFSDQQLFETHFFRFLAKFYVDISTFSHFWRLEMMFSCSNEEISWRNTCHHHHHQEGGQKKSVDTWFSFMQWSMLFPSLYDINMHSGSLWLSLCELSFTPARRLVWQVFHCVLSS